MSMKETRGENRIKQTLRKISKPRWTDLTINQKIAQSAKTNETRIKKNDEPKRMSREIEGRNKG
jgi:hypothetical protein